MDAITARGNAGGDTGQVERAAAGFGPESFAARTETAGCRWTISRGSVEARDRVLRPRASLGLILPSLPAASASERSLAPSAFSLFVACALAAAKSKKPNKGRSTLADPLPSYSRFSRAISVLEERGSLSGCCGYFRLDFRWVWDCSRGHSPSREARRWCSGLGAVELFGSVFCDKKSGFS